MDPVQCTCSFRWLIKLHELIGIKIKTVPATLMIFLRPVNVAALADNLFNGLVKILAAEPTLSCRPEGGPEPPAASVRTEARKSCRSGW